MSASHSDLEMAIADRRAVTLVYSGDRGPARTVHPHALFMTGTGSLCLESFQVSGYTTHGALPQWRVFTVRSITALEVLEERFTVAPGWNPTAQRYRHGLVARVTTL